MFSSHISWSFRFTLSWIFLAVQLEGMSYVAAAERFGVSVTTVKNHLIRATTRCLLLVDAP